MNDFYMHDIGNDKKGEASLLECEVKMLFNSECPGRKFAFAVRNPSGSVSLVRRHNLEIVMC